MKARYFMSGMYLDFIPSIQILTGNEFCEDKSEFPMILVSCDEWTNTSQPGECLGERGRGKRGTKLLTA